MLKKWFFLSIIAFQLQAQEVNLYCAHLKVGEFDKEAPQIFRLERAAFVIEKGPSENGKYGVKPKPSTTQLSSGSGIYTDNLNDSLDEEVCGNCDEHISILIEAKVGYYLPINRLFRQIYGPGNGLYGLELSMQSWKNLYAWGSASYFTAWGHSIGESDKTNLSFVPLGLGFKYIHPFCNWNLYAAAGVLAAFLNIHDHSPFVIQSISKWGVGGIVKAGALWNMENGVFIDLFTDYSYIKIPFHDTDGGIVLPHDADLSGFSVGAGVGYRF